MIGIILDCVLMLLLVAALAYGVRLEKKLTALRAGQLAFANAVTELNQAAGRAENALISLRQSGDEADLLHDRLIKARQVKTELEQLIARAPSPSPAAGRDDEPLTRQGGAVSRADFPARTAAPSSVPMKAKEALAVVRPAVAETDEDERARRMAALAERIQGIGGAGAAPGRENVAAILGALTANQAAQQSLNQARRSLDEDLFAA